MCRHRLEYGSICYESNGNIQHCKRSTVCKSNPEFQYPSLRRLNEHIHSSTVATAFRSPGCRARYASCAEPLHGAFTNSPILECWLVKLHCASYGEAKIDLAIVRQIKSYIVSHQEKCSNVDIFFGKAIVTILGR